MVPGFRLNFSLGTVNNDIDFEYANGADVNVGCGAILMGEYWYFGGEVSANKRQVSSEFHNTDFRSTCAEKFLITLNNAYNKACA